jgi:hypothetical protein
MRRAGPPSRGEEGGPAFTHQAVSLALVTADADFLAVQAMGLDAGQVAAVHAGVAGDVAVDDAHAVGLDAADFAPALFGADLLAMLSDLRAGGRGKRLGRGHGGGAERGRAEDHGQGGQFEGHVAVPFDQVPLARRAEAVAKPAQDGPRALNPI